jgi:hypothetical protein
VPVFLIVNSALPSVRQRPETSTLDLSHSFDGFVGVAVAVDGFVVGVYVGVSSGMHIGLMWLIESPATIAVAVLVGEEAPVFELLAGKVAVVVAGLVGAAGGTTVATGVLGAATAERITGDVDSVSPKKTRNAMMPRKSAVVLVPPISPPNNSAVASRPVCHADPTGPHYGLRRRAEREPKHSAKLGGNTHSAKRT